MLDKFEKLAIAISKWIDWIAGIGLVAMFGTAVSDIIGIKIFKSPVPGGIEYVAFLGVIVAAFAMAYTYAVRGHIQVETLSMRLTKRAQAGLAAFVSLLGLILFGILAWRSIDFGQILQRTGEVSMTQRIPFYPFVYGIAFCSIVLCLLLLADLLKSVLKAVKA